MEGGQNEVTRAFPFIFSVTSLMTRVYALRAFSRHFSGNADSLIGFGKLKSP
jgi:hypothetical protein